MHGPSPLDFILDAYREGIFPMAEDAGDEAFEFYRPFVRALVPIKDLHISKKLFKTLRQRPYRVTFDQAFAEIIDGCAMTPTDKRSKTWINGPIREIFLQLHAGGHAHSVECWNEDGTLAGGLYGLSIGAVFCGESMVSFSKDASKVALVHLCALLWRAEYSLLDSQFMNPHLLQFGAYEMPQEEYEVIIQTEMNKDVLLEESLAAGFESLLNDYLRARDLTV